MFRKLFKSEASVAGRGIDQRYVEFFMGHAGGLAKIGGIYDRSPELHEPIFGAEYRKIAPYINIYTGLIRKEKDIEIENLINLAIARGMPSEKATRLREVWRTKKMAPQECAKDLHEKLKESKTETNGGERSNCQKIIGENDLARMLTEGWKFVATLPSGKIVVSNES